MSKGPVLSLVVCGRITRSTEGAMGGAVRLRQGSVVGCDGPIRLREVGTGRGGAGGRPYQGRIPQTSEVMATWGPSRGMGCRRRAVLGVGPECRACGGGGARHVGHLTRRCT